MTAASLPNPRSTVMELLSRWGPETLTDEQTTTVTETLGLGEFETQIDRTLKELGT